VHSEKLIGECGCIWNSCGWLLDVGLSLVYHSTLVVFDPHVRVTASPINTDVSLGVVVRAADPSLMFINPIVEMSLMSSDVRVMTLNDVILVCPSPMTSVLVCWVILDVVKDFESISCYAIQPTDCTPCWWYAYSRRSTVIWNRVYSYLTDLHLYYYNSPQ